MKPGAIYRRTATPRPIGLGVGLHLGPAKRAAVYRSLDRDIIFIWQPDYHRSREAEYTFDPRSLDGLTGGAGKLETAAFHWLNFCRFRLVETLADLKSRPLGHRLAARIVRWADRADAIRNALMMVNTGIASLAVLATRPREEVLADELQQGLLDLTDSIDRFDPNRGFAFITYAYRSILRRAYRRRMRQNKHNGRTQSHSTGDALIHLPAGSDTSPWQAEQLDLRLMLTDNLIDLSPREQDVLVRRFGFSHLGSQKLQDIAVEWGCTRETVRQTELRALAKVRASLGIQGPAVNSQKPRSRPQNRDSRPPKKT